MQIRILIIFTYSSCKHVQPHNLFVPRLLMLPHFTKQEIMHLFYVVNQLNLNQSHWRPAMHWSPLWSKAVFVPTYFEISDCQEFVRDDGSLACYTLEAEGVSYGEALEACSRRGFTLAEVHGERDQDNLKALAQPFKVRGLQCLV